MRVEFDAGAGFQEEFHVRSFSLCTHSCTDKLYDVVEVSLLSDTGREANAHIIISHEDVPEAGDYFKGRAEFSLVANKVAGRRLLDALFRAGACGQGNARFGVQCDASYKVDAFWVRVSVAFGSMAMVQASAFVLKDEIGG